MARTSAAASAMWFALVRNLIPSASTNQHGSSEHEVGQRGRLGNRCCAFGHDGQSLAACQAKRWPWIKARTVMTLDDERELRWKG